MHWLMKYKNKKCHACMHTVIIMHSITWPHYSTRVPQNTYPVHTKHCTDCTCSDIVGLHCMQLQIMLHSQLHCTASFLAIRCTCSSLLPVTSGVPEASILGPLFFFYLSMIFPSHIKSFPSLLFADDCKCVGTIKSPSNQMLLKFRRTWINLCSGHIDGFFCSTSPSLRIAHSFSQSPTLPHLAIMTCIEQSSQQCDLGVTFCGDLSWSQHYNKAFHKCIQYSLFSPTHYFSISPSKMNVPSIFILLCSHLTLSEGLIY